ncbi:MAG: DNA-directed RNA polymerase, partial [Methanomicrobiales archaeon]
MYKSNFGGSSNYGPREMTKVVCSDCGKDCEVP